MKKRMDEARFFRNGYKAMRRAMVLNMGKTLEEAENNEVDLDDVEGSLIYNKIDDQENEVIMSVYLKYPGIGEKDIIARVGIHEPTQDIPLNEMNVEMVLNVYDAFEKAVNGTE